MNACTYTYNRVLGMSRPGINTDDDFLSFQNFHLSSFNSNSRNSSLSGNKKMSGCLKFIKKYFCTQQLCISTCVASQCMMSILKIYIYFDKVLYRVYQKKCPKWKIASTSDIPQNLGYFLQPGIIRSLLVYLAQKIFLPTKFMLPGGCFLSSNFEMACAQKC